MPRILFAVLILGSVPVPLLAAEATTETELRDMGYLILHLSNINVINGLNLTREQATTLRALALQVEAVAEKPPPLSAPLSPEVEKVRKTYLEARDLLIQGKPVPPELNARVGQARVAETRFVRATLRPAPLATGGPCGRCHTTPPTDPAAATRPMTQTPAVQSAMNTAHFGAVYGAVGFLKLLSVSAQVEATLTDAQKAILGSFACCLTPPQELSDPVRAGQAESAAGELDLLRKVRQVPPNLWPAARQWLLQWADPITQAVSPGASAAKKAAVRDAAGKIMDRARGLSDVEFEVEKDNLARSLRATVLPPATDAPHKAAIFLLIPGASRVYDQYLARLAQQDKARAQTH